MLKRFLITLGLALLAVALLILATRGRGAQKLVLLSDGRMFCIEAVTYGTNHVVGWSDGWLVPLRKVLPNSVSDFLTPAKGQSRQSTAEPTLVVWVYAYNPSTRKYVDCQGVRASFIDKNGDVYPATGLAHGAFLKGFNRQAYTFEVFPRRSAHLTLQLSPWRSGETSTVILANPGRRLPVEFPGAETLPSTHGVGDLEFRLESLGIHTNGGPQHEWEPLSRHWEPVFKLTVRGMIATNWEAPEWEAEDSTGNRGQTLGLHESILKFVGTVYPKPDAVMDQGRRWQLSVPSLPSTLQGMQWNTNRSLHDLSITVIGLFPPGSYTFSEGQLTNPPARTGASSGWTGMSQQVFPGKWKSWATHGATNYTAFLRWTPGKAEQRIAVGLSYKQGLISRTQWGRLRRGGEVSAFVFDTPLEEASGINLEVVLLEPLRSEFTVRPPLEKLSEH